MHVELTQKEIDELLEHIDYRNKSVIDNSNYCPSCGIPTKRFYFKSKTRIYSRLIDENGHVRADGGFSAGSNIVCLRCGTVYQVI